jgi:transposase
MRKFIRIGADLAKNFFQIHALEREEGPALRRKLSRAGMRRFFEETEPCLIAMEACGSAHYWGRELAAMGHEVRLIPPGYVKPYVKRGKNAAADAAAICEAMSRPDMRFVAVKNAQSQAALAVHKARQLLVKQRTMGINALRAHLAEFGIVVARGPQHVATLIEKASGEEALPDILRVATSALVRLIGALGEEIEALEAQITQLLAKDSKSLLDRILAGPLVAITHSEDEQKSGTTNDEPSQ